MLYWKRRDAKVPLDEVAASDNSGTGAGTGGGVSLEIDSTYQPTSPNAQAGTAVKSAIDQLETSITAKYGDTLRYKGTKETYSELSSENNHEKGDVWNVTDTNANYVWDGSRWDKLSESLEGYVKQDTFTSLESSFTTHKENKDTNLKHLSDTDLAKLNSIELFSQDEIKQHITESLQEKMSTGGIVTNENLESKLEELQTEVQTTVTQNITSTLSGNYVSNSDWNQYKTEHENDLKGYLKCDQADELKVFTKDGEAAPPLSQRKERIIYLVGEGATVSEDSSSRSGGGG